MASNIGTIRKQKRISQLTLAVLVGCYPSQVRKWESGAAIPYPRNRKKLASILGVDVADLGFGAESDLGKD